jgi:hypothetical protein
MVRYLSADWFAALREHTAGDAAPPDPEALVLRYFVGTGPSVSGPPGSGVGGGGPDGSPDEGPAGYDVVIAAGRASIRHPVAGPAHLTFTSDYRTAAAIAAGRLSTHAALAEGRLRVAGDVGILGRRAGEVAGLDPVPAGLRAETEY